MHDEHNETALIARAQQDASAFHQLYAVYFKRVYGYVAARIPQPQDAEDVVANVFLRALKNLPQFRNQHQPSFAAWLFTIARNVTNDHYRGQPHLAIIPFEQATHALSEVPEPDHHLIKQEESALLRELITRLPERKRELVYLRYYAGLRNQEIATVLDIAETTVSSTLSRALDDLQKSYAQTNQDDEQKVVGHDT